MKFSKLYLPKFVKSKAFILSIFIIIYLSLFTSAYILHINHPSFTRYILSDWLINYANGFVRRGLPGEILFFFTKQHILLNPSEFILFSTSLFFLLFSLIYLVKIKRNLRYIDNFNLIIVLFLPSLLLFPLIDAALGRKEVMFLILLVLNLSLVDNSIQLLKKNRFEDENLKSLKNSYFNQIFIWFNLISIPLTLTHESIIFLSLPVNMVITNSFLAFKTSGKKVIFRTFQAYFPTLLVVLACFIAKGDSESAVKICESWQSLGILDCTRNHLPGALRHLATSLEFLIAMHRQHLYNNYQYLAYLIMFMLNLLFLLNSSSIILSNYLKSISRNSISYIDYFTFFSFKYLVIPLFCSLPLYLIAVDWGRWFFVFSVSYVFCVLTPSLILLEIDNINDNRTRIPTIVNNFYQKYMKLTKSIIYICNQHSLVYKLVATYIFFFSYMSHSGMTFVNFRQGLFHKLFDYISRL